MPKDPTGPMEAASSRVRGELSHDAIRAQLERILGHRDFEASARVREFLRFVVEQTLATRF